MSATGGHNLVRERVPQCQELVMKGVMHKVRRCFLEQPLDDDSKEVNESNKIMVFLPGLAQIFQFCEILQRALDLGWTEMLIPLPFHGQSSNEDVEAVLSDPTVLASIGRYPLGQNKSVCS